MKDKHILLHYLVEFSNARRLKTQERREKEK